jgi:hypothetical protein
MKVIRLTLPEAQFVELRDLANAQRRDPQAQALVLLETALKRRRERLAPVQQGAIAR